MPVVPASLLPMGILQFLDDNGNPLANGYIAFYIPNTFTPKTVWADAAESVPLANPVVLNSAGRPQNGSVECSIYGSGEYRMEVFDQNGVQQWQAETTDLLSEIASLTTMPLQNVTSNAYTYVANNDGALVFRASSGGSVMVDTLAGGGGALRAGFLCTVVNTDATFMLAIVAGGGATLFGSNCYVGPGQTVDIYSTGGGAYILLNRPLRGRAQGAINLYVDGVNGADTKCGLNSANAFKTIVAATDRLYNQFDHNGVIPTINVASATYACGAEGFVFVNGCPMGIGQFNVIGNTGTPGAVNLTATGSACFNVGGGVQVNVRGFNLNSHGGVSPSVVAGEAFVAYGGGEINFGNVEFGSCDVCHMSATGGGSVNSVGQPYAITGDAPDHIAVSQIGLGVIDGSTITFPSARNFTFFVYADSCSAISAKGCTFGGAGLGGTTGIKFGCSANGVIETGTSGNTSYFPGVTPGTPNTGGQYS